MVDTPGLAAAASIIAATITAGWNWRSQLAARERQRQQEETAARTTAYAQVRRLRRMTQRQIEFTQRDDGMIWLIVYRSLFPGKDSLGRFDALTAREVGALTSLLYTYQESIGFLRASASEVELAPDQARDLASRPKPYFGLDMDVIEYVYGRGEALDKGRLDELRLRLEVILRRCESALTEIERAVRMLYPGSALAQVILEAKARERDWVKAERAVSPAASHIPHPSAA